MPRVRSPIKGDLYRGSLLNFWCVRPESEVLSETRLFQDLVNQQLACLERLKGAAAKLPDSWYSTEDGQKQLESLKETLLRDYFHEFDALRKNLKDQQDQKRKETLEKLR